MTKDTARASTQPAPLGKPGGPGLFHKKGQGLPVYIENIRNAIMRKGTSESTATAMAIAMVKKLVATSKDPAVKAAAAKALAQWEAAKAGAHVNMSVPVTSSSDGARVTAASTAKAAKVTKAKAKLQAKAARARKTAARKATLKAKRDAKHRAAAAKHAAVAKKSALAKKRAALKHKTVLAKKNARAKAKSDETGKQLKAEAGYEKQIGDEKRKQANINAQRAGQPVLPPGATHWKHGWIPVNSAGKPVGPSQAPKKGKQKQTAKQQQAQRHIGLAQPHDGHKLPGVVMYRYRHGWILINPAIPSRGKHAGAHASSIHHKSGGTTIGHFEHGGPGGFGRSHAKFVPEKNLGPADQTFKAGPPQKEVVQAVASAHAASNTANRLGKTDPEFIAAHETAAQLHANAEHLATAAHKENLAKSHHEAAQGHLDNATSAHDANEFHALNSSALKATLQAKKSGSLEDHEKALKAHSEAIDAAPDQVFKSYHAKQALKHQKQVESKKVTFTPDKKQEEQGAKTETSLNYQKHKKDALADSQFAADSETILAHKNAANSHYAAATAAEGSGGVDKEDVKQTHIAAAEFHIAKAGALEKAKDDHNHSMYELQAKDAQQKTDHAAHVLSSGGPDTIQALKDAQKAHYNAHYQALMVKHPTDPAFHQGMQDHLQDLINKENLKVKKASTPAVKEMQEPDAEPNIKDDIEKMNVLKFKMNAPSGGAAEEDAFVAAGKKFQQKHGISYGAAKEQQGKPTGSLDDEPEINTDAARLEALYQSIMTNDNATEDDFDKLVAAKKAFAKKHDDLWTHKGYVGGKFGGGGKSKPVEDVVDGAFPDLTGSKVDDSKKILEAATSWKAAIDADMDDETVNARYAVFKALKAQWLSKYPDAEPWTTKVAKSGFPSGGPSIAAGNPLNPVPDDLTATNYPDAKKAGFTQPNFNENVNAGWDVPPDLKSGGAYSYSGSEYVQINAQLRKYGPTGGSNDSTIAQADKQFQSLPPLSKSIVVGRKMAGDGPFPPIPPGAKAGDVFTDKGFVSTSKSVGMWSGSTSIEIRVPAGMKAMDLNHTVGSMNSSEQEVLLPRGTSFRVVSDIKGSDGYGTTSRKIVVEVVKQDG